MLKISYVGFLFVGYIIEVTHICIEFRVETKVSKDYSQHKYYRYKPMFILKR